MVSPFARVHAVCKLGFGAVPGAACVAAHGATTQGKRMKGVGDFRGAGVWHFHAFALPGSQALNAAREGLC